MPAIERIGGGGGYRPVLLATLAAAALGACATTSPPAVDRYTVEVPAGVTDARGRFREIFCSVLQHHGTGEPDYRPCEEALTPVVDEPAATGQAVPLDSSRRRLFAAVVAGVGYSCFAKWLDSPGSAAAHLRKYQYDLSLVEVDALSGIERNAKQIRDAVMAMPEDSGRPRLVLVGYSKGAPDILEAVVRYPEIHDRIAAIVSAAGAVGGSALANDAEQEQAELLRHWPGATCDKGDGGAVTSLRPDVRTAWMAQNSLPPGLHYYSLVTLPTPDRVSRLIRKSYRKLGEIDWRNDSQVIYYDQVIPGSTLLGFLNADHWAIAIPLNRSHPIISRSMVDQNDYPREALLEAVLRFIEEDLNR